MTWFNQEPEGETPKQLVFKSNEAAFQMACKYMHTSLENEKPVLGVIIEKDGDNYGIKLSNPDDPSIPTESISQLIEAGNIKHLSISGKPLDHVPPLQKGDLVLCIAPAELVALGAGTISVIIVAKVKPILDMKTGWVIETR